ncbi:hypothetical protein PG990_003955 [Apiospora arundinis]
MNAVSIAWPITVDGPVSITATASTVVAAAAKLRLFVTQGDVSLEEVGDTIILPVPGISPTLVPAFGRAGLYISSPPHWPHSIFRLLCVSWLPSVYQCDDSTYASTTYLATPEFDFLALTPDNAETGWSLTALVTLASVPEATVRTPRMVEANRVLLS